MNVLMFFPYAPLPPPLDLGGTKRNLPFLIENLKRHKVSVLSYGTKKEEEMFRKAFGGFCKHIVFIDRKRPRILNAIQYLWLLMTGRSPFQMVYRTSMQKELDRMLQQDNFDIVHCCTPMMGYFRFPREIPVVSDTHEVTYDLKYRTFQKANNLLYKMLLYLEFLLAKRAEIKLCQRFEAVISTTDRDYEVFRKNLDKRKLFVISNGVQSSFLEPSLLKSETGTMVFTGLMSYYPNNHGILYFLKNIFPLILNQMPNAKIFIVGKNPSKELLRYASEQVVITGYVEDVRPYMARAEVFIIPLLIGGGIRGKALEAMAMKIPIVTTSIGCESIHLKHEDSALFADQPVEFADAVLRLFKDESLRMKLTNRAYQTVLEQYNWTEKGNDLQRVYEFALDKCQFKKTPKQRSEIGVI
jgi:polysaccharide biosynthesis protein PslH